MPQMTRELLAKCTGHAKRKRDEDLEHFLRRITHLYCAEKGIERIVSETFTCWLCNTLMTTWLTSLCAILQEDLSVCRNLSVLYLYDNFIYTLENLSPCQMLTHLYLQNNNISHISNLSSLHKLSKL